MKKNDLLFFMDNNNGIFPYAVSYTHLDVYKRQNVTCVNTNFGWWLSGQIFGKTEGKNMLNPLLIYGIKNIFCNCEVMVEMLFVITLNYLRSCIQMKYFSFTSC